MPDVKLREELVELTRELVRIPSTHSRPQEIDNCARFIEDWLARHDIPCRRLMSAGVPTLLVLPAERCPVLLMSHFDVVEADDEALFQPRLEDGRLFGRGTIDDKYGVATSLLLYREQLRALGKTGRDGGSLPFGLMFTGDEEVGGANGAAVAAHQVETDFFLAIDGGRPDLIVTKEKGILQLELTAYGSAAHAARPWLGRSAFDILSRDYRNMQELFAGQREDHWHRTMVLTKCRAGNGSANIVPEEARAVFDIRYTENDNPEELVAEIRRSVQSSVTVHALEPVFQGGASPYLDLLVDCSGGAAVGFEHGASDARYLSQLGVPGAIWGADGEMSQHSRREHITLASLYDFYDRLARFGERIQEERARR